MVDKETKTSLYVLETLLEEKGLSLMIHSPEVDVINNKYFDIVKKIRDVLNNDKLDDFMKVDNIVNLLLDNNIDTDCNDF